MSDETVPLNYVPILLFIGLTIAVGSISLWIGRLVRPHRPYRAKLAPYESGSPLFQDAQGSVAFAADHPRTMIILFIVAVLL